MNTLNEKNYARALISVVIGLMVANFGIVFNTANWMVWLILGYTILICGMLVFARTRQCENKAEPTKHFQHRLEQARKLAADSYPLFNNPQLANELEDYFSSMQGIRPTFAQMKHLETIMTCLLALDDEAAFDKPTTQTCQQLEACLQDLPAMEIEVFEDTTDILYLADAPLMEEVQIFACAERPDITECIENTGYAEKTGSTEALENLASPMQSPLL